ncbi:MAG TPA: DUF4160 domain-containing protein [Methylomirabilota bacterium]|nr:DUF4160 domain-containing protein [Methylomirabilota bacterium]
MPTLLRSGPYRVFFYSGDRDEPRHVYVERDANRAKFWLEPVRLAESDGLRERRSDALSVPTAAPCA